MAQLVPYARLLALAALTSLTLTSCFDRDKKCDPRPACGNSTKTAAKTTATPGT